MLIYVYYSECIKKINVKFKKDIFACVLRTGEPVMNTKLLQSGLKMFSKCPLQSIFADLLSAQFSFCTI